MTQEILNLKLSDLAKVNETNTLWTEASVNKALSLADRVITMIEKKNALSQPNTQTKQIKTNKQEIARSLYNQFTQVMATLRDTYDKKTITEALEFLQQNEAVVIEQIERGI